MRNTVRRVCAIVEHGRGAGAWLVLARLGRIADPSDDAAVAALGDCWRDRDGIVSLRILHPDPALCAPLASEASTGRLLDPVLLIGATTEAAAIAAGAAATGLCEGEIATFRMLWHLPG